MFVLKPGTGSISSPPAPGPSSAAVASPPVGNHQQHRVVRAAGSGNLLSRSNRAPTASYASAMQQQLLAPTLMRPVMSPAVASPSRYRTYL